MLTLWMRDSRRQKTHTYLRTRKPSRRFTTRRTLAPSSGPHELGNAQRGPRRGPRPSYFSRSTDILSNRKSRQRFSSNWSVERTIMSYSRQQRAVFCRDLPLLKCLFFGEGRAASLHAAAARERSSNFLYYRRSSRKAAIMTTTLHVSVICEGQAALFLYRALLLLKCLLQGTSGVHILHTAFTARQLVALFLSFS
jgi:hypothetical protein